MLADTRPFFHRLVWEPDNSSYLISHVAAPMLSLMECTKCTLQNTKLSDMVLFANICVKDYIHNTSLIYFDESKAAFSSILIE